MRLPARVRDGSDGALWRAVHCGDPGAFGELFDRYADLVYRYAFARLRYRHLAEDVVSTVFSEAWRQRERIDLHEGSLRPWLLGVTRNQANRVLSQQARHRSEATVIRHAGGVDDAVDVSGRVDAPAELAVVLEAIAELPDGPREVLLLHVWGELSHEAIAAELGVAVGTVKSRLSRARQRLAVAVGAMAVRATEVVDLHGSDVGRRET